MMSNRDPQLYTIIFIVCFLIKSFLHLSPPVSEAYIGRTCNLMLPLSSVTGPKLFPCIKKNVSCNGMDLNYRPFNTWKSLLEESQESKFSGDNIGSSLTVQNILKYSQIYGRHYITVNASDNVLDVLVKMKEVSKHLAIVYNDQSLIGLFTKNDYISSSKLGSDVLTVAEYATPKENLIGISYYDYGNNAMEIIQRYNVPYLVISDYLTVKNRLSNRSKFHGIIRREDITLVAQMDKDYMMRQQTKCLETFERFTVSLTRLRDRVNTQVNSLVQKHTELMKNNLLCYSTVIIFASTIGLFHSGSEWIHVHANIAIMTIFILGYVGIIFEDFFRLNKGAIALIMSTGMWVTYADFFGVANGIASTKVIGELGEQLSQVSDICLFLLAASTIVELMDSHQGFTVVTNLITSKSKKSLFWTIGLLTFFFSAVLNNLTVTIVMCSLLRKLVPNKEDRKLFGAMVVVAANAGGVWTPIGDVTTTMLWINNQLSTIPTVTELFLPSIACFIGSLSFISHQISDSDKSGSDLMLPKTTRLSCNSQIIFWSGIASLLFVPIFAEFTGLPPYLAMLTGLSFMWILTDVMYIIDGSMEDCLRVPTALSKLDMPGILFFLGILMSIGVLDKSGMLKHLANCLNNHIPSEDIIAAVIGIASSLIDNVPLVAATMGMYDLGHFGTDHKLWQLIALCAGTGGSILLIGSSSGIALMGLEKVEFIWYAKKVSIGAFIGYLSGIATYSLQNILIHNNIFTEMYHFIRR